MISFKLNIPVMKFINIKFILNIKTVLTQILLLIFKIQVNK